MHNFCVYIKMTISPLWRQLSIAVATQFASFSAGAAIGYPAVLLHQLRRADTELPLDLDTASWIGSIHGLAGIPAISAPLIMQWRGRKFAFRAGCLLLIIGWVIVYLANSTATILLSESFHGFGANVLITVSYDCLSEMITPAYRNILLQFYGIINVLVVAITAAMTKFVYWRTQSIILVLPAIVAVLISITWLESPLWLAFKEDLVKCEKNFIKIRGTDEHSTKELLEVMAAHKDKLVRKRESKDVGIRCFFKQIKSRDFVMPALHILLLLNHSYWSGYAVILLYSVELIAKATQNETAAFIGNIVICFVLVISAIICSILMKFSKNKTLLIVTTCGTAICLFCVSLVSYLQTVDILPKESLLSLYFLVGYMITAGLGQSSVVFTMCSELMPVKHRGLGGAFFVIYACSMHASTLKISPYLFVYLSLWGTFLVYAFNCVICGFLIWKYVPETKGKTLQEIENFYMKGTFQITLSNEESEVITVKDM